METFDKHTIGKIHSIESFGTVDGPGIRFVVFMQGCSLQCQYCHNRDSWDLCAGKKITVDELMQEILKYTTYFKASHGGVTISGGEPLLQTPFLITLFQSLKKEHIHTAIDTSGMFTITKEIEELISLTDLFLLDIKHIDNEKCKKLVGCSNKKELDFAKYLSKHQKPMWLRQVLIPGLTDDKEDLLALKHFISTLKTVEKVELLPYHAMGKYKWEQLGFSYPLDSVSSPTSKEIEHAKHILEID